MANVELNDELTRLGVARSAELSARGGAEDVGAVLLDGATGTVQQALDKLKVRTNDVAQNLDEAVNTINKQMSEIGAPTFTEKTAASVIAINVLEVAVLRIALTAAMTEIQITGLPAEAGITKQITLIFNQGVGARQVTWPSSIVWPNGRKPVLSFAPGAEDIVTLMICGSDTKLYGFFSGGSFSA